MVEQSPFTTDDNLLYVGSKKTSLFIINSESGQVHACYGYNTNWCFLMKFRENTIHGGDCEFQQDAIYLGRVDYSLQAIDKVTHKQAWNITVGEFISPATNQVTIR